MAITKKYNHETNNWDPIIGDASTIYTKNALLTKKYNGEQMTVEDILLQNRQELDALLHNVSWLALHGGGGSGTGGIGGVDTPPILKVLDPQTGLILIESLIWTDDIEIYQYIPYSFAARNKNSYSIRITMNGNLIQLDSFTAKNYNNNIPMSSIKKYLKQGGFLSFLITNTTLDEIYDTVSILITVSTVSLSVPSNYNPYKLTIDDIKNTQPILTLNGSSTIYGQYRLYYANSQISITESSGKVNFISDGVNLETSESYIIVNINDSLTQSFLLNLKECGLISESIDSQNLFNRYYILVKDDDPSIRSSQLGALIIVTVTDGILVVPQTGSILNPLSIAKDNILSLEFTVFSSLQGTYDYSIMYKREDEVEFKNYLVPTVRGNLFNQSIRSNINILSINDIEESKVYIIKIIASYGSIISEGSTAIRILKANATFLEKYKLDLIRDTIFDFDFIRYDITEYTNDNYIFKNLNNTKGVITSRIKLGNIGSESKHYGYYRSFKHFAYGVVTTDFPITVPGLNNQIDRWFPDKTTSRDLLNYNNYLFTIEIAYKIQQTPLNNKVIFNLGDYLFDVEKNFRSGSGIVITAHKLYIKIEDTIVEEDLEDDAFIQLDIVCKIINNQNYLQVYKNAKQLVVTQFKKASLSNVNNLNLMFIGGYQLNGDIPLNNIDLDLYALKFYSTALNDGQIICSFINNYGAYNAFNGPLPALLMTEMCTNNGIVMENEFDDSIKTSDISDIYDLSTGTYKWKVEILDGKFILPNEFQQLPIPTVVLSVNWTFDEFRSVDNTIQKSLSSRFEYYDNSALVNRHLILDNVSVDIQGTTSSKYIIKNLSVEFPAGTLFSPKDTWFPERLFNLKADIVDSGHINNATIGKFINDCFNNTSLMNVDKTFPCVAKLKEYQKARLLPETFTIKAAIEGFPCLLIVNFASNSGSRDVRILGLYSFNLGREAYYNLGYKIPKKLFKLNKEAYAVGENVDFPNFFGESSSSDDNDLTYKGICFEGQLSLNSTPVEVQFTNNNGSDNTNYNFVEIDMLNGKKEWYPPISRTSDNMILYNSYTLKDTEGNQIPYNSNRVKKYKVPASGYFLSNHPSYYDELLWKYVGDKTVVTGDVARLRLAELNNCVSSQLYYNKGTINQQGGSELLYQITGTGAQDLGVVQETNQEFIIDVPSVKNEIVLNVQNTAFYYVLSLLFGLIDSLGKNLQLKYWISEDGNKYQWSPAFYDMDTALGLNNLGIVDVTPDALDYSLINTLDNQLVAMWGAAPQALNRVYTVYSNKLWGIESSLFVNKYVVDYSVVGSDGGENLPNSNFFAQMWNDLRKSVLLNVDSIYENYFAHQFDGCGEFLMNYDYLVKYIDTGQQDLLHGDRLSYIKNWLTKRIKFLDSVFGYNQRILNGIDFALTNYLSSGAGSKSDISYYEVSWNNNISISHNSGTRTLPVTTNAPVIIRSVIGGNKYSYTFVPDNTETEIVVAGSDKTLDIQTMINNSNCIIDFSSLKELDVKRIIAVEGITITNQDGTDKYVSTETNLYRQYGSLSSIETLDLSYTDTLSSSINFFTLFKTWDNSPLNKETFPFGLLELNLREMKSSSVISVNLDYSEENQGTPGTPSVYSSPFVNLISIDCRNAGISSLTIPKGISLYKLDVSQSAVQTLVLLNLPLLKEFSVSGCASLSSIQITNCPNFTELKFDESNISLVNVEISNCENLKKIEIISNSKYKSVPNVSINGCENLTDINITDLINGSDGKLQIRECPKLNNLNLSNSQFSYFSWDKKLDNKSLNELNFYNTSIHTITTVFTNVESQEKIADLTGIDSITKLNFARNKAIEYVKFNNSRDKSFEIANSGNVYGSVTGVFRECSQLKRVYGNVLIKNGSTFYLCTNFSILGDTDSYLRTLMIENGIVKHFADDDIKELVSENGRPKFLTGDYVTNMTFANGSNAFYYTSCTLLDLYYALYNIGSCTNLYNMFYGCTKIKLDWDNCLNINTFINCKNVTTINGIIRSIGTNNVLRLISPILDDSGNVILNGLLTPLNSLKSFSTVFYLSGTMVFDRNLFRRNSNWKFSSMYHFDNIMYVVDDIRNYSSFDEVTKLFTTENMNNGDPRIGNLDGFFKNFTNTEFTTTVYGNVLNNLRYINYDFLENGMEVPYSTKNNSNFLAGAFRNFCRSTYSHGTIKLDKIFKLNNGASINVGGLYTCFTSTNAGAEFNINDSTLNIFTNLKGIGHYNSDDLDERSPIDSFTGIKKKINLEIFPYLILQNNKSTIQIFSGFFKNAEFEVTPQGNIKLPQNLFDGCELIRDVSYLFFDFNNDYELTSEGFKDCTNLTNVSKMFAVSINNTFLGRISKINHLLGSIPKKLFYHGGKVVNQTIIQGIKEENSKKEIAVDNITSTYASKSGGVLNGHETEIRYTNYEISSKPNVIIGKPDTLEISYEKIPNTEEYEDEETGEILIKTVEGTHDVEIGRKYLGDEMNIETFIIPKYSIPNNKISDISNCFQGASVDVYNVEYTQDDIEYLSTYNPFKYVKNNNIWSQKNVDLNLKTLKWVYDGRYNKYKEFIKNENDDENEYLFSDDVKNQDVEDSTIYFVNNRATYTNSDNKNIVINIGQNDESFCCAPDLLRYCTVGANVSGLFKLCGQIKNGISTNYLDLFNIVSTDIEIIANYGLKGRIPPYLLLPVYLSTDLSEMFMGCKLLGWYTSEGSRYTIPKTFFLYSTKNLNLTSMFKGVHFPVGIKLNVFNNKLTYNVTEIFKHCSYDTNSTNPEDTVISDVFRGIKLTNGCNSAFACEPSTSISSNPSFIRNVYVTFKENFVNATRPNNTQYVYFGYNANSVDFGDYNKLELPISKLNYAPKY